MRLFSILVAIALLAVSVVPAQASRLEDLQKLHADKVAQINQAQQDLLRIEGAIIERQNVIAEAKAEADKIATEELAEAVEAKTEPEIEPETKE